MKLTKLIALGCFSAALVTGGFTVSYADDDDNSQQTQDGCCNFSPNKSVVSPSQNQFNTQDGCCSLKPSTTPRHAVVTKAPKKDDDDIDIDPDIDI